MTANGTFAKTFALFILVLVGGAVGWSQVEASPAQQIDFPAWTWVCLFGAFALAMVCVFKPKASPFVAPFYAVLEGVFLGAISKVFELHWDGIVFQAVLATVGVFFATLALYVFGVVKVTRKFQMVVIGATCGIFLLYVFGALLSLFGVDVIFWNEPSALGIGVSVVICCVASLNLVPRLRVHPPVVRAGRAEVHGVVRRVRDHGDARVALHRDAATALATPAVAHDRRPDVRRHSLISAVAVRSSAAGACRHVRPSRARPARA